MIRSLRNRRFPIALGVGALAAVLLAGPAAAHVSVTPDAAPAGSSPTLTFRVPNERPVPTVSLRIVFPDGAPIPAAQPAAKPGWTTSVATTPEDERDDAAPIVQSVTWSGGEIAVDGEEQFVLTVGPLPGPGTIAFRAVQTYADGEIVRWNQPPEPDGSEPERPAPVLTVGPGPKPPTPATSTPNTGVTTLPPAPTTTAAPPTDSGGSSAALIGVIVLVGAGIVGAGVALRRRRPPR
ncbi:MAG: YcnI family protein [Actinomycetota bacterium]